MNLNKLNQISSKFLFTDSMLCYEGVFNPFIDYNEYILQFYLAKGVRFNFDFAQKLYKYYQLENENVLRSISASYIMNNKIDVNLLSKYVPYNFWYPKCPSKETCIKLLEIDYKYHVFVAILSLMNKWDDVLKCCHFNNKNYLIEEYKEINDIRHYFYVDIFQKFNIELSNDIYKFYLYNGYSDTCCNYEHENYLEYCSEDIEINKSNDICFVNSSSIEYVMYKNDFIIPFINFKIEDIKYSFSLAQYILKNHNQFTNKECSYALSVFISIGIMPEDLIEKYNVFHVFSYKVPSIYILRQLFNKFSFLKYNIAVALCMYESSNLYYELNLEPDIDILSIAEFYNNKYIIKDMLNKNEKTGKWYRHLDFKNAKNIMVIY